MNATAASLPTEPLAVAAALEGMVSTVLLIGEWLLKQQQQLARQQRLLEEKQRRIEALQKEKEELKDCVEKLKNRSSQNSSVPPSADHLKKPSDKSKRSYWEKAGAKIRPPRPDAEWIW
jgi:Skp family chaperone for outer membrane proteins